MAVPASKRRARSKETPRPSEYARRKKEYRARRDLGLQIFRLTLDTQAVVELLFKKNIVVSNKKLI
jgi:hypothetical protein